MDVDIVEEGSEEVGVVVHRNICVVSVFVALERLAVRVDLTVDKIIICKCDDVWSVAEKFNVFLEEEVVG